LEKARKKQARNQARKEGRKKEVQTRSAIEKTIHENLEFAICSILKDVKHFSDARKSRR
jgi:hypothetical protein